MIGPRRLGPSGPAVRSSATRSFLASEVAPLAECSYRIWRPTQLCLAPRQMQFSTAVPKGTRCFSSAVRTRRSHTSWPDVTVHVDQHGIESLLHDPPMVHSKVKRLRPVPTLTPDAQASDMNAQPHVEGQKTTEGDSRPGEQSSRKPRAVHAQASFDNALAHAPPRHPTNQQAPARFKPSIPTSLLRDYLTSSVALDADAYHQIQSRLPPDFHRIDAYLLLREHDPQSLSAFSYFDILSLIKRAGKDRLGGVLSLLLEDTVGSDLNNPKTKPGHFQVSSGTEMRYKLLREILIRSSPNDFLLHDGAALKVFKLMLDDLVQVRQSGTGNIGEKPDIAPTPISASSVAEDVVLTLPDNFPTGEARSLIKLILHLHHPELAPILKALRAHLEAHTPDFPAAREGAQLIAYYLQPNLREFGAALDVVRALRDTNAVAQEVVDDAIQDGKAYLAQFQEWFSSISVDSQARTSDEVLQQICMDVSLRLVVMKILMEHRPKGGIQFRKAFESLSSSLRLDLIDLNDSRGSHHAKPLLDVPMRSFRSVFLHLVGQNDKRCLTEALFVLQRSDQRLVALLPNRDLQDLCDAARISDALPLSAETYALVVKAKTSPSATSGLLSESKHVLARDATIIDTDAFLAITQQLLSVGEKIVVIALLRALRLLPLTDSSFAQLNLRFSAGQRARLHGVLAEAGMTEDAFELFQYWSHWQYETDLDSLHKDDGAVGLRRAGSVQVGNPLIERQVRLMHDTGRDVAISTSCLVALVRGLCRPNLIIKAEQLAADQASPVSRTEPSQLKKARFVIDVFRRSCTPMDWTHYRLNALARACFIAKDVPGAFDALAKISFLRAMPDQMDISVLLGGLVDFDADKAVDLFIRHCTTRKTIGPQDRATAQGSKKVLGELEKLPTLEPMDPTPALTSMLINRTLAQNRMDLVDKLYEFSEAAGIASSLGQQASLRAIFQPGVPPAKVTQTVQRALTQGWPADPALLEKLAQLLLRRSMKNFDLDESETRSAIAGRKVPPKRRLDLVRAAVLLSQISAQKKDVVNLRTVSRALHAISSAGGLMDRSVPDPKIASTGKGRTSSIRAARRRGREERRLHWIACLDSIVHMLRWTKFFDTGDDYRQSLPLWKSSQTGNGELISVELNELLDPSLVGRQRHQRRVLTSAAAATSPIKLEAADESSTVENTDDFGGVPTDGVVQQVVQRSANVLPADLFCRVMEAYLAIGDVSGAAEVASWMRDEAKIDLGRSGEGDAGFVDRIKAAVFDREVKRSSTERTGAKEGVEDSSSSSSILRMLAGQQSTAHTKSWWAP